MRTTLAFLLSSLLLLSSTNATAHEGEAGHNQFPLEISRLFEKHSLAPHLWLAPIPPDQLIEDPQLFIELFTGVVKPSFEQFAAAGFQSEDGNEPNILNWTQPREELIRFSENAENLWLAIDLVSTENEVVNMLVEITGLNHSSWFYYDEYGELVSHIDDISFPMSNRDYIDSKPVIPLRVLPDKPFRLYISLYSAAGITNKVDLWQEGDFQKSRMTQNLVDGFYFGLAFALVIYNFFLFIALKQRAYLYFSLFVMSSALSVYLSSGIATLYGFNSHLNLLLPAIFASTGLVNLAGVLFTLSLLRIRETHARLYHYFMMLIVLNIMNTTFTAGLAASADMAEWGVYATISSALATLVEQIIYIYTLIYYWSRSPVARYWFLAMAVHSWAFILWTVIGETGTILGLPPRYLVQGATVIDTLALTALLSYNFRADQIARNLAQKKSLESLRLAHDYQRAKNEFVATVGHDLHGPVRAISFFAQSLKPEVPDASKSSLAKIDENVETITDLLDNLVRLSSAENQSVKFELRNTELSSLLTVLGRELEVKAKEKNIDLEFDIEPSTVVTDRISLSQVLRNLIDNAIKYTDEGSVKVKLIDAPEAAYISITDTGIGIPASKLEYIFDDFYQVTSNGKKRDGVGLGLSIVARLTESLGIEITVTSKQFFGSNFKLTVPKNPGALKIEADTQPVSIQQSLSLEITVLIVGNTASAGRMEELLGKWGDTVVSIATPDKSELQSLAAIPIDLLLITSHCYHQSMADIRAAISRESTKIIVISSPEDDISTTTLSSDDVSVIDEAISPMKLRSLLQQLTADNL